MKLLRNIFLLLVVGGIGLYFFGPREPIDLTIQFKSASIGNDLDGYLAAQELQFDDIKPDNQKRIVWAGEAGVQTELAIVYAHGFSSSSGEIRPVPEKIAAQLGANLYYMRLAGHGRADLAMSEPVMNDWMQDMAEAMEIGRRLGKRVVVISTSTGGTLAILATRNEVVGVGLAGLVLVSPNFEPVRWETKLANWPLANSWVPLVAGEWVDSPPENNLQDQYWTNRYQSIAGLPMMALVKSANALDFSSIKTPALFIYSKADQVVKASRTEEIIPKWGGAKQVEVRTMGPRDGATAHVIAGDAVSPSQNSETIAIITKWIAVL